MAVTVAGNAPVASVYSTTNASPFATASYTPTANRLMLAFCQVSYASAVGTFTTPTSNGLTWVSLATLVHTGDDRRYAVYGAKSGATPSAGTFSLAASGSPTGGILEVFEIDGADLNATLAVGAGNLILQAVTAQLGTGNTASVTLAALTAPSAVFAGIVISANETITPEAGVYAGISSATGHASPTRRQMVEWADTGDTSPAWSWTTSGRWIAVAVEVKEPSADNQLVTPTALALTTAKFAPTVTVSDNQTVTPTTLALTATKFAPTVTLSDHQLVTPTTRALTTASFAPTVTASDHQTITPSTTELATSSFEPTVTVGANQVAVPGVASLATETFAPTVTLSDHQTVTPGVLSLVTEAFAPSVAATEHQSVTPSTASLTTATFAPSVVASNHQSVTPSTADLTLETFEPSVNAGQTVVPALAELALSTFAPSVEATQSVTVEPAPATLTLVSFAPTIAGISSVPLGGGYPRLRNGRVQSNLFDLKPAPLPEPVSIAPAPGRLSMATFAPTVDINDDEMALMILLDAA